jgi:hypothetical protein
MSVPSSLEAKTFTPETAHLKNSCCSRAKRRKSLRLRSSENGGSPESGRLAASLAALSFLSGIASSPKLLSRRAVTRPRGKRDGALIEPRSAVDCDLRHTASKESEIDLREGEAPGAGMPQLSPGRRCPTLAVEAVIH